MWAGPGGRRRKPRAGDGAGAVGCLARRPAGGLGSPHHTMKVRGESRCCPWPDSPQGIQAPTCFRTRPWDTPPRHPHSPRPLSSSLAFPGPGTPSHSCCRGPFPARKPSCPISQGPDQTLPRGQPAHPRAQTHFRLSSLCGNTLPARDCHCLITTSRQMRTGWPPLGSVFRCLWRR